MKILFISDIVLDPVVKALRLKKDYEIKLAFHEDLLGGLFNINPEEFEEFDLIFIHTDVRFKKHSIEKVAGILKQIYRLAGSSTLNVLCSNLIELPYPKGVLSNGIGNVNDAWTKLSKETELLNQHPNFYWFNLDQQFRSIGYDNIYTYSLGHLYQMPYNKKGIQAFSELFMNMADFLSLPEKKVIVLDCDNTLWKGIVGEDGIAGIRCDLSQDGIQSYHLQQFLLERKNLGFLLCLCSKNNEEDVKQAFDTLNMPLIWNDFIVKKVNWEDKTTNIRSIAQTLNLGIDSFIFMDDSDFEVQSVNSLLPEVTVYQISQDYSSFLKITESFVFCRKQVSSEDLQKHQQYLEEISRKEDKSSFDSMEDYIRSLEIKLDVRFNDPADFERVAQLTQKTNQFNFNKIPYSAAEIAKIASQNKIFTLRVSDKYGDYGLVGVIIFLQTNDAITLHNFIMSCRALGRRIETDFLRHVTDEIQASGSTISEIQFVKTDRNKPAEDFYLHLSKQPTW